VTSDYAATSPPGATMATTSNQPSTPTNRAALHAPLPEDKAAIWSKFGNWDETYFPQVVGLQLEEAKVDYARLRLPYRPELRQPAGVVHGGAIATLIDTVVVPAVGAHYPALPVMLTIDMQIRYLGAAREADLVAEGWVVKRGKSIVFCEASVTADPGNDVVAEGWLTYRVIPQAERPGNGSS
jgi:uncharacterized protein (TIGR00369 family)